MHAEQRLARRTRRRVGAPLIAVSLLVLGACQDSPLEPEAFAPEPCTLLPAFTLPEGQTAPTLAAVSAALTDAADRLTLSFPEPARGELRDALRQVAGGSDLDRDARCRGLLVARGVLSSQEESPETLPDRSAIRLAVELAMAALAP